MNATERIAQDHQHLLDVFDDLEATIDELQRSRLIVVAAERLKLHSALEEDVFYPALRARAAEAVDEAQAAHRAIDLLLDEAVGSPSPANVTILRRLVSSHLAEEEARLFPVANELGADVAARLASDLERYVQALSDEEPAVGWEPGASTR